jgi:transcriptional regulator with XRE-family HTH domain
VAEGGAVKIRSDRDIGVRIAGLLGDRPQRELAEAVGMQPPVLSRALAGERAFNMSEVVDIADYLGVPAEELLFDEQPAFVKRGAADDGATNDAIVRCSRLIDAMLQIEAVGR